MRHIRRAAAKKELGEELTDDERQSVEQAVPREVLRAYIAYAKQEVKPYIHSENTEVQEHLREQFLQLRLAYKDEDKQDEHPVPVTFRQEEAIERLAEASARIRLDDEVRQEDVNRALSLVKRSMEQVGIDPETGEYDADVVETGQSSSQRTRRKRICAILEDKNGLSLEELIEIMNAKERRVRSDIQRLKEESRIYEMNGELRVA